MAEIIVDTAVVAGTSRVWRSVVFTTRDTGYVFYIDADSDVYYKKTTNGGLTWGSIVVVSGAETMHAVDVWYDQWTPGDTGSIIHIWYFGLTNDTVTYRRLDTASDTLSAAINVLVGASSTTQRGAFVTGAKMRGGNLYCCFNIDNGAETGTYRSTDNGATWASRTNVLPTGDLSQVLTFPANVADPNDCWFVLQNSTNNTLALIEHDDSANTNAASSTLAMTENITDATGQYGFSGSIRHQDGHLILAYFDLFDNASENFLVYDINGTGSLTALTQITTNVDDMYYPSVFLNQDQPDWIYIAYIGKSDGSDVLLTSASVYYALSKDRGVTWTKDIAYSENGAGDWRQTWAPLNGERFMVVFMDISAISLNTNNNNSKEFGATTLNNYQFAKVTGQNNTGILSVTERIR